MGKKSQPASLFDSPFCVRRDHASPEGSSVRVFFATEPLKTLCTSAPCSLVRWRSVFGCRTFSVQARSGSGVAWRVRRDEAWDGRRNAAPAVGGNANPDDPYLCGGPSSGRRCSGATHAQDPRVCRNYESGLGSSRRRSMGSWSTTTASPWLRSFTAGASRAASPVCRFACAPDAPCSACPRLRRKRA